MHCAVRLRPLEARDREQFIRDNQEAFYFGAVEEFGCRDQRFEEEGQIISRETIQNAIDAGEAYRIVGEDGAFVGGVVLRTEGAKGELDLLFVAPGVHSKGIDRICCVVCSGKTTPRGDGLGDGNALF